MSAPASRRYCRRVKIWQALRRHERYVVAGAIAALYAVEILLSDANAKWARLVAAACFGAALVWRRTLPVAALVVGFVIIVLDNTALRGLAETGSFLIGFLLALYCVGRWAVGRQLVAGVALMLVAIPVAAIEPGQSVAIGDIVYFLVFFGGPVLVGRVVFIRQNREVALLRRTTILEREQELAAQQAVARERARIARELHDVVSHAISVIVLQARGGRTVLEVDPARTCEALDVIERAGEQALGEMRRLLGVLRSDEEESELTPQPGVAQLPFLLEQMRATGLGVTLAVEGDAVDLPPGIDVSAYRIVQEGLTNALKHAGDAEATVTVRYLPRQLEVEIVDDGSGVATGSGGGSGYGLVGIRERVGIYGGTFEYGRPPVGGFRVRALLPLEARA
jgi:signal transduction histidine kinase